MYECNLPNIVAYPFRLAVGVGVFYVYLLIFGNIFIQCILTHNHDRPAVCALEERMKAEVRCFRADVRPNATDEEAFKAVLLLPSGGDDADAPKVGDKVPCYYAVYRGNVFIPRQTKSVQPTKGTPGRNYFVIIIVALVALCFLVCAFGPFSLVLAFPPILPPTGTQQKRKAAKAEKARLAAASKVKQMRADQEKAGGKKLSSETGSGSAGRKGAWTDSDSLSTESSEYNEKANSKLSNDSAV